MSVIHTASVTVWNNKNTKIIIVVVIKIISRAFCDGMCRYGIPGNENEECIFCML